MHVTKQHPSLVGRSTSNILDLAECYGYGCMTLNCFTSPRVSCLLQCPLHGCSPLFICFHTCAEYLHLKIRSKVVKMCAAHPTNSHICYMKKRVSLSLTLHCQKRHLFHSFFIYSFFPSPYRWNLCRK